MGTHEIDNFGEIILVNSENEIPKCRRSYLCSIITGYVGIKDEYPGYNLYYINTDKKMVQSICKKNTNICKYTKIVKYINNYGDKKTTYFLKDEFRRMMNYE